MTGRDLRWRAAGLVLSVAGCAAASLDRDGSPETITYFMIAITGLVLMLNGKRVPVAWQAERRGHGPLAGVIQARRLRQRARPDQTSSPKIG